LTNIINKFTCSSLSNSEISNLKTKVDNLPEFYGTGLFQEKNFKAKIEAFIDIDIKSIQFSTFLKLCSFCSSNLSGHSRSSKAVCFYFAEGPKSVQLQIKECQICGALHDLNYAEKKINGELK